MKRRNQEYPIVLVFRSSHVEISRRAFDGLFAFARQAGWNVQTVDYARAASVEFSLPPHTGLPDVSDLLAFWRPAGCIVEGSIAPWALDPKMFSSVPTVFFEENPDRLPRQAVNVTCDGEAIAACAARELLSLRLDDYAFVASDYGMVAQSGEYCSAPRQPGEIYWCRDRRLAFERLVRMNGRRFHLFAYETITRDSDTGSRRRRLARWIADLPKPCGILAANDYTALQVIAACNELKIEIPDEVALVGVDDDASLCENSTPTLSSVRPDHERCGWQAAELLDEMITSGKRRLPSRTFGVAELVRRESSLRQPGTDVRVRRAIEFVRRNACAGVEPPQVIAEMGCSRSLANLRFRQSTGHTILDEIHAVRLTRVKELLLKPTLDVASIPDFCGCARRASLLRAAARGGISARRDYGHLQIGSDERQMKMIRFAMLAAAVTVALSAGAFSFVPSKFGGVYRSGEDVSFTCSNVTGNVKVAVCDGWLKPTFARTIRADASGLSRLTLSPCDVGGRYGAYRVTFRADSGESMDTWFAYLPGKRHAPERFYGTGSHAAHGWARGEFRYLDLLSEAGIGAVRDDLYIDDWEDGKGGFKVPGNVAAYVRELNGRGVMLNFVLGTRRPYTRERIAPERFERWATFLSQAFRGKDVSFEIWNEPQNFAFKEVHGGTYHGPDAKWIPEFVTFTRRVKEAFRAANCEHPVLLTAEDYLPALKPMIEMGIAGKGEIVSIHPYCHSDPRPEKGTWFLDGDGKSFRALAAKHGGCDRFRATEAGWTTVSVTGNVEHAFVGCYPRVTYVEQAQYIIRMFTIARQIGLEQAFQYDFVNDGTNRFYTEHNFGLVNEDYSPKPSYAAVAAHISLLRGMEPKGDEGGARDRLRLYRFQGKDGRFAYVAWAVEGTAKGSVPRALGTDYELLDIFGNALERPRNGDLLLTEVPVYLVCGCREGRK